jgi:cobalt/nickel transport protein
MKNNKWWIVFIFSVLIGGLLSLFASSYPDGLEKVAETQGFLEKGKQLFPSLISSYQMPGIRSENLATSLSGIIGTVIVFAFLFLLGKLLYRSRTVVEE